MKQRPLGMLCAALLAALLSTGCGTNDPLNRQAVSGTVTLDGTPLEQGVITFQPEAQAVTSGGAAIAAGKYAIPRDQGLVEGKYKVLIRASKSTVSLQGGAPGEPVVAPELIPEEYNSKSDKVVDVTAKGPNTFDFDIVTKK